MKVHAAIIGEARSGKSQIFEALFGRKFVENTSPTFVYNAAILKKGKDMIDLYDFGDGDPWEMVESRYLESVDSILYCIDFSKFSEKDFENFNVDAIKEPLEGLEHLRQVYPTKAIILVATKCDHAIHALASKQLERLDIDPTIQRIATSAKDRYGFEKDGAEILINLLRAESYNIVLKKGKIEDALMSAVRDHPTTIPIVIDAMKACDSDQNITILAHALNQAVINSPKALPYLIEAMDILELDATQKTEILSREDAYHNNILMQVMKKQPEMVPDILEAMQGLQATDLAVILSAQDNTGHNALMWAAKNLPSALPKLLKAMEGLDPRDIAAILTARNKAGCNALMLELQSNASSIPLLIEPMRLLSDEQNAPILETKGAAGPLEQAKSKLEVYRAILQYVPSKTLELSTSLESCKDFKGRVSKKIILSNFQKEIENCGDLLALEKFKAALQGREEYRLLGTHKRSVSNFFNQKTDSLVELEALISAREKTLTNDESYSQNQVLGS